MSLLTNLICTSCSKTYDSEKLHTLCECGKVLFAQYDLEKAKETITNNLKNRPNNLWRMYEIMPCGPDYRFTLGEGNTPIINFLDEDNFQFQLKNEGFNPTGTFKARGLCAAVSRAVELG
ncbi:MAG: threonine synthase, partial [Candidatus Heimdallarchaeota archaeon]